MIQNTLVLIRCLFLRSFGMSKHHVALIPGDGIGPEVVAAAQRVLAATGVAITWEECEAGAAVFRKGLASGVPQETIDAIARTRVVLKGPLETPVGYGEKSANVTLRKLFETYGNIRPVRELPGVPTRFTGSGIDLVVVRENVEDLYAGIEHMQTPSVAQCLKLISAKGCEKIVRLAFEFARSEGRTKVHCATKANIMKLTEGMLKRTFEQIAVEYPDIEAQHIIIDNCAHQLVRRPEQFDVIVTTNMNGDIISDLTSGLIGGLGFAPSANIGNEVAIFEAVHGSAPKYAGKDVINPSAMILSAVLMLRHLHEFAAASAVENAVMVTLESGLRTRDVAGDAGAVGTVAFTDAIISNLDKTSAAYNARQHTALTLPQVDPRPDTIVPKERRTVGMDVFIESALSSEALGHSLEQLSADMPIHLKMISNRGTKVYTPTGSITDCVDHWRCRFVVNDGVTHLTDTVALELVQRVAAQHRWMHLEKLEEFDGELGFTRAQGED
jgi:isocitrate dehydrogenase